MGKDRTIEVEAGGTACKGSIMPCTTWGNHSSVNRRSGPGDGCDRNGDEKWKQWFCDKWGFRGTGGRLGWKDEQIIVFEITILESQCHYYSI